MLEKIQECEKQCAADQQGNAAAFEWINERFRELSEERLCLRAAGENAESHLHALPAAQAAKRERFAADVSRGNATGAKELMTAAADPFSRLLRMILARAHSRRQHRRRDGWGMRNRGDSDAHGRVVQHLHGAQIKGLARSDR